MEFTTPPPLADDEVLAVVALSRPTDEVRLGIGRERLADLGVETRVFPTADPDREEPATPSQRAADVEDAFIDPSFPLPWVRSQRSTPKRAR